MQINVFRLDTMEIDPAIVMIAKRRCGKSWIVRDIAYHYRKIPGGTIISPTDKMNPFYKLFFPDIYIHYDISPTLFQKILARQATMIEKAKIKKKEGKKIDPRAILIMDDCLADKGKWEKDQSIREILMNGRHFRLMYILTMQTPLGIKPDLRLNFDYVFALKELSEINRKKLMDNYCGILAPYPRFVQIFSMCTANHKALVIDNTSSSDDIEDRVFWFKAENRKFTFGCKKFKELHKKYYDPTFMKRIMDNILRGTKGLAKDNKNQFNVVLG
jgi:hypothetical protein